MAIAFDAATSGGFQSGNSSQSFNHTITGSNPILFICLSPTGADSNTDPSSVTYNGVAATLVSGTKANNAGQQGTQIWVVFAPATGTNSVSVGWGTTMNAGYTIRAVSYTGAQQTGPADSGNAGTAGGTTVNLSTTTVADNCWAMAVFNQGTALTAGTGTTQRLANSIFDTNAAKHPAGSVTLQVTESATQGAQSIVSFAPFTAPKSGFLSFF